MACRIEPHCNACDLCVAICPVNAILETGAGITITALLCTECLGYAEEPVCMRVCPTDAIVYAGGMQWNQAVDPSGGGNQETFR